MSAEIFENPPSNDVPFYLLQKQLRRLCSENNFSEALCVCKDLTNQADTELGASHELVRHALATLGQLYRATGESKLGLEALERAAELYVKAQMNDHRDAAHVQFHIGIARVDCAEYDQAKTAFKNVVNCAAIKTENINELVFESLRRLVALTKQEGDIVAAVEFANRRLVMAEHKYGIDHQEVGVCLEMLGHLEVSLDEYSRAHEHYKRAHEIYQQRHGPKSGEVGVALQSLGFLAKARGDLELADRYLTEAIPIYEVAFGQDSERLVYPFFHRGQLLLEIGDFVGAERDFLRVLALIEFHYGPDSPEVVSNLHTFLHLFLDSREFERAEPLMVRALRLREMHFGPMSKQVALTLLNFSILHLAQGRFEEAEATTRRIILIGDSLEDVELVTQGLHRLAQVFALADRPDEEWTVLSRMIPLLEDPSQTSGEMVYSIIDSVGRYYRSCGHPTAAEHWLRGRLRLYENECGELHPNAQQVLRDLATNEMDRNDMVAALGYASQAHTIFETQLNRVLSFASERQRFHFLANRRSLDLLATAGAPNEIAQAVLRTKGIVLESVLEDRRVSRDCNTEDSLLAYRRLTAAKKKAARLELEASSSPSVRGAFMEAVKEVEAAQREVAVFVSKQRPIRQALEVTVSAVQNKIPSNTTLIEYLRYAHYLGEAKESYEDRYGAILISSDRPPTWIAIGSAEEIDELISQFLDLVCAGTESHVIETLASNLYSKVWNPISMVVDPNCNHVVISPDGALSFLSFASLINPDGEFLAEKVMLSHVATGRDLLRERSFNSKANISIFAHASFDQEPIRVDESRDDLAFSRNSCVLPTQLLVRSLCLSPLPGTEEEAHLIRTNALANGWQVTVWEGDQATKHRLLHLEAPLVLHIATHGFILEPSDFPSLRNSKPCPGMSLSDSINFPGARGNPMLRAGIALAGAQTTLNLWEKGIVPDSDNDGIVTAEDAALIDLEATLLVTLSACDTGRGEIRCGEGILGLRRGFQQAGAQSLVVTLWAVADRETAHFMNDLYDRVMKGEDPSHALALTQRQWLKTLRQSNGCSTAITLAGPFVMTRHTEF